MSVGHISGFTEKGTLVGVESDYVTAFHVINPATASTTYIGEVNRYISALARILDWPFPDE